MALSLGQSDVSAGDTEKFRIDYQDYLESGELLTGTPTIVEVDSSELTINNKAISTAELTILSRTVAIGQAVTFDVTGFSAGTTYKVRVTATTDASVARTRVLDLTIVTAQ